MSEGRTINQNIFVKKTEYDVKSILKFAKKCHENYILKSNQSDLEEAIAHYIKVMKMDPSIAEVYYKLACLLWEKGQIDIDTAIAQCQNAINLEPDSSNARLYLGYFLKTAGNYNEAIKEFKNSIKLGGLFSSRHRITLATVLFEQMKVKKTTFKDFLQVIYYFCSGISMVLIDYNFMRMLYKTVAEDINVFFYRFMGLAFRAIKNYNMAIKTYECAAENTCKSHMFYDKMGDLSLRKGLPSIAVDSYQKALKLKPDDSILWVKLATLLQDCFGNNVNQIKECYNNLVEIEPNNPRIYYELGHLYLKLEDKFSAVNAFKKAVELDIDNPFYHNSLAYSLIQLDDFNGAIEEYQKAIKLNPDNEWTSVVCQAQGAIYHQVHRNLDAAIVSYQSAIVLDSKNVDAYISLGEAYQEKHDLTNAIDCFCEAIKLDPDSSRAYSYLGLALWDNEYIEEAIIAYQKVIELDPSCSTAYNNLGLLYLEITGMTDEAILMFDNAIKSNPNCTTAYYNKGRAFESLGDKNKAAENYQMALDLNKLTEHLEHEEIEKRLFDLFSV